MSRFACGYTPDSFRAEFSEIDLPQGTSPEKFEERKRAKSSIMSRKCVSATF